jgi:hypothetical protein
MGNFALESKYENSPSDTQVSHFSSFLLDALSYTLASYELRSGTPLTNSHWNAPTDN